MTIWTGEHKKVVLDERKMEIALNNRCKICLLLKTNKDLWVGVHKKVIEEGISHSVVCKWLNGKIEVLNADREEKDKLSLFNNANFTLHFKKHISDKDAVMVELNKWASLKSEEVSSFSEGDEAVAEAVVSNGSTEFQRISNMIDVMEENLDIYSRQLQEKRKGSGNLPLHPKDIGNYSKFVSDLIAAKQDLNKLRNVEQTAVMAIDAAIEYMVKGMGSRVVAIAEETKNILTDELGPTSLANQIAETMVSSFSGGARELYRETVEMIRKDYGLKR